MFTVDVKQQFNNFKMLTISESYVADEIITSRAGVRVRVGNTDAEGRMVMADVLCRLKERVCQIQH